MATEADWTISPREGLGKLRFGMSPTQVDALSAIYGVATGRRNDRIPDDILLDTLATFGDAMSDEDKQALLAVYAELSPATDSTSETRGTSGLILRYQTDQLVEIMPDNAQRPLFLDGADMFSLHGSDALALLERRNGGPGRYADTEAAFDTLAVSVAGFCVTDPGAGVLMLDDSDERFAARSVVLRAEPYLPDGEMDRFVTHKVTR